jgi:hypothetical protein
MLVGDEELGREESSSIPKAEKIDPFQLCNTVILRRRLFLTIAAAAVLVAIGAILGATLRKPQPNDANQMLSFADFRDSYLPTETLQRAIEDPKSPQGQALAWIEQDAQESSRVAWRMLQRYASAVVYFSLQAADGLNGTKWLSSADECTWDSFFDATSHAHNHESACDGRDRYFNLALANRNLTGVIPPEIGLLANLMLVELSGNLLVGSIPPAFGNLTNLNHVFLESNSLTGTIPTELGLLEHVVKVVISYNNFSGPIPAEIGRLLTLKTLYLEDNRLSGSLPTELGMLPVIEYFDFSGNHLTGSLPVEVTKLQSLVELHFCLTRLTGTIPTEIALLQNLERFSLAGNVNIRGSIPSEIGSLSSLADLVLEATAITGTIPLEL